MKGERIVIGRDRVPCGPFGLFRRTVVWTEAKDAADLTNGGMYPLPVRTTDTAEHRRTPIWTEEEDGGESG